MNNEDILRRVKKEAGEIEIPKSLSPKQMRRKLEEKEICPGLECRKKRTYWRGLTTAACLCLVLGGSLWAYHNNSVSEAIPQEETEEWEITEVSESEEVSEQADEAFGDPNMTYEDIYASMLPVWEERNTMFRDVGGIVETSAKEAMKSDSDFGTTNIQTVGVDEGDIVKNDGRYLYQVVDIENEDKYAQAIQIVDTKDGLNLTCRLEEFDRIAEFYVWEDTLVVIENKYYDYASTAAKSRYAVCDVYGRDNACHEIVFYNIEDRTSPKEIKTFTLQGSYDSSRIADGYFYGFSRFYADPGEGESDYEAYVPAVDGTRMQADQILLPEENKGTSYLVLVSVDLKDPTKFVQTRAVVSSADLYYVSSDHIYVTDAMGSEAKEGWVSNQTSFLKFSYGNGMFALQAKGEIKGSLDDSFSLDEYDGYLRAVTTIQEYEKQILVDDRTGETIGYDMVDEKQTNALYVLDEDLHVVGSIEGLAEDEQIYSARFMGDTGYFVTFRQTDPLFAVDLSDPKHPKVLSELKVSGFSDYLHFYGEDRLLGIGMEADEETGRQEGLKLSMFDISDPANVQETARLQLEKYNYSEALYNHKAVMISTGANLFGFEAEGSQRGNYWRHYLVFSYENDKFIQELTLDVKNEDGEYSSSRGTFIGHTVYLLCRDGSVRSYDCRTGEQLESLEP